ncbi:MAG: hypothetical protein IJ649_03790 [Oscillospiraceae bacterium]|nr:hypothetical protein [Oscillospiraceae bacterium]
MYGSEQNIFPDDPIHNKRVYKYNALPVGWRLVKCDPVRKPPKGWRWAHNNKDMMSRGFRVALIREPRCSAAN